MWTHFDAVPGHHCSTQDRDQRAPGCPLAARDVLDEAVRRLAISSKPLDARARAAVAAISSGLSAGALADGEERELLRGILAAAGSTCAAHPDGHESAARHLSDATAEAIALDILDLRDTIMGRAIRSARTSNRRKRLGRPRSPGAA